MSCKPIAIACDIECTDWDIIGGDLISAAFVEILEDYTLGRDSVWYHRPLSTKYFSDKSQDIHGISYWKAQEFPIAKQSCISMLHWLKPLMDLFPLEFVYHGSGHFDWRWIKMHFSKSELEQSILKAFGDEKPTSTVTMARKMIKQIPPSTKINPATEKVYGPYSLRNVADYYRLELDHHQALSDARACAQIYCNIKKGVDTWTGELAL